MQLGTDRIVRKELDKWWMRRDYHALQQVLTSFYSITSLFCLTTRTHKGQDTFTRSII
jgi:hypothetical protein